MRYLVDTGILLRLFKPADADFRTIRSAVTRLRNEGHVLTVSIQNLAEFWNVCNRPAEARGGFGLSGEETDRRLRVIERICVVLPEQPTMYGIWRQIVKLHGVKGVQVHDARLAAWMRANPVNHVVTLNGRDFSRYSNVVAITPAMVLTK